MECIVLAGGLGTRLQGVIGSYPKCMAAINNKPFLHYLFEYLQAQKCTRVILSLGFKHEVITEWLHSEKTPFETDFVIEEEPLGTGGGISLALSKATDENVVVLNGDTMFMVNLQELFAFHKKNHATTTLALKQMYDFNRYGTVRMDEQYRINSFEEKKQCDEGLINGGVYVLNKQALLAKNLPVKYSFEKDYLETFINENRFYGFEDRGYFIDIGIPEDYMKAQEDFKTLFA